MLGLKTQQVKNSEFLLSARHWAGGWGIQPGKPPISVFLEFSTWNAHPLDQWVPNRSCMRITWRACSSPDRWGPTSASLTQPAWSGPREAAFLTGSQVMLILLIWDNCCPESLQDCCRFAVRSLFQRQFLRGAILEFLAVASLHMSPFSLYCIVFFWLRLAACWILVLRPEIEPMPLAVEAQSPPHWTLREFPSLCFLYSILYSIVL